VIDRRIDEGGDAGKLDRGGDRPVDLPPVAPPPDDLAQRVAAREGGLAGQRGCPHSRAF
jgi:hypothetical protein